MISRLAAIVNIVTNKPFPNVHQINFGQILSNSIEQLLKTVIITTFLAAGNDCDVP